MGTYSSEEYNIADTYTKEKKNKLMHVKEFQRIQILQLLNVVISVFFFFFFF